MTGSIRYESGALFVIAFTLGNGRNEGRSEAAQINVRHFGDVGKIDVLPIQHADGRLSVLILKPSHRTELYKGRIAIIFVVHHHEQSNGNFLDQNEHTKFCNASVTLRKKDNQVHDLGEFSLEA